MNVIIFLNYFWITNERFYFALCCPEFFVVSRVLLFILFLLCISVSLSLSLFLTVSISLSLSVSLWVVVIWCLFHMGRSLCIVLLENC